MKETKFFFITNSLFLMIFIISALFLSLAKSEEFIVGDDQEWSSGTNYQSWSKKYNFSVGDVLVFKYVKGQHDAYEVEEDTYRSCDGSSGVINKYESGSDRVELTQAKKYWFICNVDGHCLGGMRFSVDVQGFRPNSTDLSPTQQPVPAPPKSSTRSLRTHNWLMGIYLLASGILLPLYF
ncbi:basic blue protein [Ziziphus jujuba]|uniref:Basic blue protein n=2 Tax=Ziziphus jujuba TaxID=326968 RepID=A0A6P4AF35_ZIZJJ|nr:basic blue protein [Ziziphus jujuba]KAH7518399.1 hypothetical protein FEM48_Zijuj09G0167500 [Ziziphus jujuba var. spinosa]